MGFNITDGPGIDPGIFQGLQYQAGLGIGIGYRIAVGSSPMINRTAFNNGINMIMISNSST